MDSKHSYSYNYDEFEDFENEDEHRYRQRYQRDRSGHRYFKYDDDYGVYERGAKQEMDKKPAMIWGGKQTSTSLNKFKIQTKDSLKKSEKPRRPLRDDRKYSPYQKKQEPKQQTAVPAVRQVSNSDKNNKDLRPAVFIKDLKKRSYKLEEEKA